MKKMEILNRLTDIISPSGYEEDIIEYFRNIVSEYVDETYMDEIGNLIVLKKCGIDNAKTILITAHADEIGFVVKRIDSDGYLYVVNIGGVNIDCLPGKEVIFQSRSGRVHGAFGEKPIHMAYQEKNNSNKLSDLWIDIGCASYEDAEKIVSVGDYGTFAPSFHILNKDYIMSKSLDNRLNLYVIYKVLQKIKNYHVNIVFAITVQEEIGRRGAMTVANTLNIKECIVLDVAHATDYPSVNINQFGEIKLGKGPIIPCGANICKGLRQQLENIARMQDICIQKDVIPADSRTDAAIMQNVGYNREVAIISVPIRYMHSTTEMANIADINSAIDLLVSYIEQ